MEIDLEIPKHDLVIVDGVMSLFIFRQEKPISQPQIFHYQEINVLTLERSPTDKMHFPLTDESNKKLQEFQNVQVIEVEDGDDANPDHTLTYLAPIQTLVWKKQDEDDITPLLES